MTTALIRIDQEEQAAAVRRSHALHEDACALAASISLGFMRLAEVLLEIRDGNHWRNLDSDSWISYCNSPELGLSYRQVARLIGVYETFRPLVEAGGVTTDELAEIGSTKLDIIRREIVDAADPSELLAAAKTLSVNDLKLRLREDTGELVDEMRDYIVRRLHAYANEAREGDLSAVLDEVAEYAIYQRSKLG